jgi:hypothetical protein
MKVKVNESDKDNLAHDKVQLVRVLVDGGRTHVQDNRDTHY